MSRLENSFFLMAIKRVFGWTNIIFLLVYSGKRRLSRPLHPSQPRRKCHERLREAGPRDRVHNDEEIRSLERTGVEILSSVVPGSNLHEKIHNPIDSGIDEG